MLFFGLSKETQTYPAWIILKMKIEIFECGSLKVNDIFSFSVLKRAFKVYKHLKNKQNVFEMHHLDWWKALWYCASLCHGILATWMFLIYSISFQFSLNCEFLSCMYLWVFIGCEQKKAFIFLFFSNFELNRRTLMHRG